MADNPPNGTTAAPAPPVSKRLLDEIEALMTTMVGQHDWTLISPSGQVWSGSQREVARALFQNIDIASLFTKENQHG